MLSHISPKSPQKPSPATPSSPCSQQLFHPHYHRFPTPAPSLNPNNSTIQNKVPHPTTSVPFPSLSSRRPSTINHQQATLDFHDLSPHSHPEQNRVRESRHDVSFNAVRRDKGRVPVCCKGTCIHMHTYTHTCYTMHDSWKLALLSVSGDKQAVVAPGCLESEMCVTYGMT
jgi:hypothetical protein